MARRSLMNIFTIAMIAIIAIATITVKSILQKWMMMMNAKKHQGGKHDN